MASYLWLVSSPRYMSSCSLFLWTNFKNKNYKKIVNLPQVLFFYFRWHKWICWWKKNKISFTCWFFVVFVNFTKHQFIGVSPERVPEYGHRVEVHIRVRALCLVCTGSIIVPNGTIYKYPKQEVIQHADISIHQTTFYISIIIQAFLIPMWTHVERSLALYVN